MPLNMSMKLFVLFAIFVGYCEGICNKHSKTSPAICRSRTTFEIYDGKKQFVGKKQIFECPTGLVCAARPEVCVNPLKFDADCPARSTIGSCNVCEPGNKYACVSQKEFVLCLNGVLTGYKQKCQSYCGGRKLSKSGSPCTKEKSEMHCTNAKTTTPATTTTSTTSTTTTTAKPSSTEASVAACKGSTGSFAVTSDTSCKSYFYCYLKDGVINRSNFICPANYVFDDKKKRCVNEGSYVCSY